MGEVCQDVQVMIKKNKVIQLDGRKVCALKIACLSRWLTCKGNFSKKGFDLLDLIVWIKPAKKSLLSHILKVSKFRAKCPSYEQYLIASGFEFSLQWINWFWKHWVPTIELKRAFILVAFVYPKLECTRSSEILDHESGTSSGTRGVFWLVMCPSSFFISCATSFSKHPVCLSWF